MSRVPLDRTLDVISPWQQGGGPPATPVAEDVPAVRENDAVTQTLQQNAASLTELEQMLSGVRSR